ncbi:MAG: SPFH domain-containing protein [Polyangia bacterium]
MTSYWPFVLGILLPCGIVLLAYWALRSFSVSVEDGEVVLCERFGRHVATLREPGLHLIWDKLFPWVSVRRISLRRDFLKLSDVHVADREGTTVIVDVWIDYRVTDPLKAEYAVANLEESLRSLVMHAALSLLGRRTFYEILCDRCELAEQLRKDIRPDTERWGVGIELVFLQKVSLLPEVATQILSTIAARLGRARAELIEEGRLVVATLEAKTSVDVAALTAEAKGQYPLAIGRAMAQMGKDSEVLWAYNELYRLSLLRPHRATAFLGFEEEELRATDALMIPPNSQSQGA